MTHTAKAIRQHRKERKQTLQDISTATGLSVSYLSDIERGRTNPSLKTLQRLAAVYNIPPAELVSKDDTMCNYGTTKDVRVHIPSNLSHTGEARWDTKPVDACIADLVDDLNKAGVITLSSCCGHGKSEAEVSLLNDSEKTLSLLKSVIDAAYKLATNTYQPEGSKDYHIRVGDWNDLTDSLNAIGAYEARRDAKD